MIPIIAIFNAANYALRTAKYSADLEMYGAAAKEVAVAGALVQLLQTYDPPQPNPNLVSGKLEHLIAFKIASKESLSGVAAMFQYQVLRWDIDLALLDDGLFKIDEA